MTEGVSTSMDQLVGLLEKEGVVKLADAARSLNTDKSHIESWAKMLEKEGMLEIHYSVIGGAIIKKGPKFDALVKASIQAKPSAAEKIEKPKPEMKFRPTPEPKGAPEDYLLIRRKIEEEEQTIANSLEKLAEEQSKVVQCMATLVAEGKKLEDYIEGLRRVVEASGEKRGEKLNSLGSKGVEKQANLNLLGSKGTDKQPNDNLL